MLRLVERSLGERTTTASSRAASPRRGRSSPASRSTWRSATSRCRSESGLVLVEEIAREHPETAIVLVTGVDDPEVAEQAFRLGAHGYLVKPFWPGQLLITAANALRQHQLELAEQARATRLCWAAPRNRPRRSGTS